MAPTSPKDNHNRRLETKVSPVRFDEQEYEVHKSIIALLMGNLFLRHLNFLYREFDGDLLMPIVLGEIGHHNVNNLYSLQGSCIDFKKQLSLPHDWRGKICPTNAFSISAATGIPRETVRRKIDKLIEKGWIVKTEKGDLTVSGTVSDHFAKDFNKRTLVELIETSECLKQLLGLDENQT